MSQRKQSAKRYRSIVFPDQRGMQAALFDLSQLLYVVEDAIEQHSRARLTLGQIEPRWTWEDPNLSLAGVLTILKHTLGPMGDAVQIASRVEQGFHESARMQDAVIARADEAWPGEDRGEDEAPADDRGEDEASPPDAFHERMQQVDAWHLVTQTLRRIQARQAPIPQQEIAAARATLRKAARPCPKKHPNSRGAIACLELGALERTPSQNDGHTTS